MVKKEAMSYNLEGCRELAGAVIISAVEEFRGYPQKEALRRFREFRDTTIWFGFFPKLHAEAIEKVFEEGIKND